VIFRDDNNRELVKIDSTGSVWVQHDITPLEVAKVVKLMSQRIEKLEQENDDMREDLLMWGDNLRLQQRINKLEQENDAMRADLLLWNEKECK